MTMLLFALPVVFIALFFDLRDEVEGQDSTAQHDHVPEIPTVAPEEDASGREQGIPGVPTEFHFNHAPRI